MFNSRSFASLLGAICLLLASAAQATPYKVDFSATNYQPLGEYDAAPQSSVSGSIEFTAGTLFGEIDAITAVNLVINGHVFTVDEVTGIAESGGYLFGGKASDVFAILHGTDDFWLLMTPFSNHSAYTKLDTPGAWISYDLVYSYNAVPEPSSVALASAALAALVLARRRRQQRK